MDKVGLRVGLVQLNPVVGDLAGNAKKILAALEKAKTAQCDLVAAPELCLSGYPPEDLLLKPRFLEDCRNALIRLARDVNGPALVVGFPEREGKKVFNAAALIAEGRVLAVYRKIELPNYGVFDEKRYFSAGAECPLFIAAGIPLMLTVCEDIWIEGGRVEKEVKNKRARLVLNISGSPFHAGKLHLRKQIVCGFAERTAAHVLYNNLAGGQDELVFDGGSMWAGPDGSLIAMAERFKEDLLIADIPAAVPEIAGGEENISALGAQPPAISIPLPAPREKRPAEPRVSAELSLVEEVYLALLTGLRDYVKKNGFHKVVLGLSGGIDSSLTAALAVAALGKESVVGVTMPSQYTSQETLSDAERLARNLGIELLTIPIRPVFERFMESLSPHLGSGDPGVAAENLQARIRGNILMTLSNRFGWLVLTTGNKSETAVGYCTLYGDTAGGFAVIKDVPKTMVYELARHVNQTAGREIIPKSVMERPPTAELRPGQKDEDSLPPYEMLDLILKAYVEEDKSVDEIAAMGFDYATVVEVAKKVDKNEYKRRQAPPGIKITPKAFGKDRRLPITNHYHPGFEEK